MLVLRRPTEGERRWPARRICGLPGDGAYTVLEVATPIGMHLELPVLFLATPSLWLLDATSDGEPGALSKTPPLILNRMFQVGDHIDQRFVDIVAENEVHNLITACKKTIIELTRAVATHSGALSEIALEQQQWLDAADRRARAKESMDEFARWWGR